MKNIENPNYKSIYRDIIRKKYPEKEEKCNFILKKTEELTSIEIIKLNELIFETQDKETDVFNQKHKSYDQQTIMEILEFQKKNKYNNVQLSNHFRLSRNTITKWKKLFLDPDCSF